MHKPQETYSWLVNSWVFGRRLSWPIWRYRLGHEIPLDLNRLPSDPYPYSNPLIVSCLLTRQDEPIFRHPVSTVSGYRAARSTPISFSRISLHLTGEGYSVQVPWPAGHFYLMRQDRNFNNSTHLDYKVDTQKTDTSTLQTELAVTVWCRAVLRNAVNSTRQTQN
jgi:hypothetical protein